MSSTLARKPFSRTAALVFFSGRRSVAESAPSTKKYGDRGAGVSLSVAVAPGDEVLYECTLTGVTGSFTNVATATAFYDDGVDGPVDELDHAAPLTCFGSKMGIDATHKWKSEGFERDCKDTVALRPCFVCYCYRKFTCTGDEAEFFARVPRFCQIISGEESR